MGPLTWLKPKGRANRFYLDAIAEALEHENRRVVVEVLRQLCLDDLFFLLVHVLNRADIDVPVNDEFNENWYFDRCREVQKDPDGHLDLWSREHGKSSIITFGLTIQNILQNPELTVGIFSHKREISMDFLGQIKRELEGNELLQMLFPDVLWKNPRKDAPVWTQENIIVKRKGNPKEATIEAWGLVDNQPTGRHFDLMVYDDVVTRESVTTAEMINKTTKAWEDSLNLTSAGGRIRYIGTRWSFQDTYKTIIDRHSAILRHRPGVLPDGTPLFWNRETLEQKRASMGPQTFACQILLNPSAAMESSFNLDWIKHWHPDPATGRYNLTDLNLYLVVDPAGSKKKGRDYTAMVVFGLGSDEVYRVIDMVKDKMNLDERTDELFNLVRKYRPLLVGYEKYAMQSDIEHIEYVQRKRNFVFNIQELSIPVAKAERIAWLFAPFREGRILLPESVVRRNWEGVEVDVVQDFINNEYGIYAPGITMHDDMLDCMANMFHPNLGVVPPVAEDELQVKAVCDFNPFGEEDYGRW